MKTPTLERLHRHIVIADDCWIWEGGRSRTGYGLAWDGKRQRIAHRLTFELVRGPIPEGLTLDHLCRNRPCVNPDHLEPVPLAENLHRSPFTIASQNAAKTHCPQGHPYSDANTYVWRDGRSCRTCRRDRARAARAVA